MVRLWTSEYADVLTHSLLCLTSEGRSDLTQNDHGLAIRSRPCHSPDLRRLVVAMFSVVDLVDTSSLLQGDLYL